MGFSDFFGSYDDDMEYRRYIEEQDQQQMQNELANQQAQAAQQQAFNDSMNSGSGQMIIQVSGAGGGGASSGNTGGGQAGLIFNTFTGETSGNIEFYTGVTPSYRGTFKRNPNQEAESFIYGLNSIDPGYIKEIVLLEHIYMQIVDMLGYNIEKNPDIVKSLQYHLPYGSILLKNEVYQFDLDKYIEDGPKKELVE